MSGQDYEEHFFHTEPIGIPYLTGASCIVDGEITTNRWTSQPRCISYPDDVLLVCKGSGYGAVVMNRLGKAHIARQFMALRPINSSLDSIYNYYLACSVVAEIKKDARGLIAGIARDAVLQQRVLVPSSMEQKKIGVFFDHLDHLITLHQRKLKF